MAKNIFNGNTKFILMIAVIIGTGLVAWGEFGHVVKTNAEDIDKMEVKKADKELVETQMGHLHEEIVELKTGQQAIMKKLDEIR